MKTNFYIVFLFAFLSNCDPYTEKEQSEWDNETTELISNSFIENQNQSDFEIINLDSLKNFRELIKKMQKLSCEAKSIGLEFKQNDTIYKLTGWAACPSSNVTSCHFNRNTIYIKNDSLKNFSGNWDKMVHINHLDSEIKNITLKNHHFQYNKNILKPALIHLHIEDKFSISKTKEVLKEITRQFEKINAERPDFFRYNILFEGFSWLDIPPPPPPPELKKK
ncbi:hypothetical protein [Algibacter mikhailovii]|uniref:hypothetical protein n=1 Tax=Algibacter mikhailovii TaxID=425498 RepID=UPI00167A7D7B|nr:hypothetical protein [Algibacter mikhailovii]